MENNLSGTDSSKMGWVKNHYSDTLTSTIESFSIGEYTTTITNNSFTIKIFFLSGFDGACHWLTNGIGIVFPG